MHMNETTNFDQLCVTLVNFLLGSLENVEERVEERRLLNADQFDAILRKMEEDIENNKDESKNYGSLPIQIQAYFQLLKEDKEITQDFNDPKELFNRLERQVLQDGFVNEFASILSNLITLPASAGNAWRNISKVVSQACAPIQAKMLANSKGGAVKTPSNISRGNDFDYPSFQELKILLSVKESDEKKEKDATTELKKDLETAQMKILKLEKELENARKNPPAAAAVPASGSGGGVSGSIAKGGAAAALEASLAAKLGKGLPKPAAAPAPAPVAAAAPAADDGLNKYRKMLKMRLPPQSVMNKMRQDKVDASIIAKFEETGQLPGGNAIGGGGAAAGGGGLPAPPIPAAPAAASGGAPKLTPEEEAKVTKYRKMLKMKLPEQSVKNKMKQDKIPQSLIDKMFGESGGGGGKAGGGGLPKPVQKKPGMLFFLLLLFSGSEF